MSEQGEVPNKITSDTVVSQLSESSVPISTENSPKKGIPRRRFLQFLGVTAAGVALGSSASPQPAPEAAPASQPIPNVETSPSPELEGNSAVLVMDLFNVEKFVEDAIANHVSLHGTSAEEMWKSMGVENPHDAESIRNARPENEDHIKLLLIHSYVDIYKSHGDTVIDVMKKLSQQLGQVYVEPVKHSTEQYTQIEGIEYDELHNPSLMFRLDEKAIDDYLSTSDEEIVNMSFEMGRFGIKYEMNELVFVHENPESMLEHIRKHPQIMNQQTSEVLSPARYTNRETGEEIPSDEYDTLYAEAYKQIVAQRDPSRRGTVILDGYAHEDTYDNLKLLTTIARKYPSKKFIAAGGNPVYDKGILRPDIREARRQLEEEGLWSDNIFMVGVRAMDSGMEGPAALGDDIYIDYKDLDALGYSYASSWATPIVTTAIRSLTLQGVHDPKVIMDNLKQNTKPFIEHQSEGDYHYDVLDLEEFKQHIQEGKAQ